MSTATLAHHTARAHGLRLRPALALAATTLALWRSRARERAALRELPPEMLRDVGITPEQARDEVAKPFWRA